MRGKEKAIELVDKFYQTTPNEGWLNPPLGSSSMEYTAWGQAKECAIIAVDEMISFSKRTFAFIHPELEGPSVRYLEEVKQEIEKL